MTLEIRPLSAHKFPKLQLSPFWRRTAWIAALLMIGGSIAARAVHADLSESSLRLGRGLGAFQRFAGPTTNVVWNGQEIAFQSKTVPASVQSVIEDFVATCKPGVVGDELATRLGQSGAKASSLMQRLLVLRDRRGESEGTAVCFAGLTDAGLTGMAERFKRFAANLDLSELGATRYLYARQIPAGTQLLFLTADGPLKLDRLAPSDGRDAEGHEPIAGARPKHSVRLISAHTPELPYGLTTYRSSLAPGALLSDYAQQAKDRGYELVDLDQVIQRDVSAALASRADYRVLKNSKGALIASAIPDGSGSLLSIVQFIGTRASLMPSGAAF